MGFFKKLASMPAWAKGVSAGIASVLVAVGGYFLYDAVFGYDKTCCVIPENAAFVMKVDAKELLSQSDIDLKAFIEKMDIDEKDVKKTGINLKKPGYVFAYNAKKNDSAPLIGVVVALSDAEAFEEFVEDKSEEKFKDKGDYKLLSEDEATLAFDDDKALLLAGADEDLLTKQVSKLMTQGKSESIVSTKLFEELNEGDNAISCVLDYGQLLSMIPENAIDREAQGILEQLKEYKDFHMRAGLRIEDNKFIVDGEVLPQTDKAKKQYEKSLAMAPAIKGKLLGCTDNKEWIFGSLGIDGTKIMNYLSDRDDVKKALNEAERELGFDLSDVVKAFDGDAVFSLGGNTNDRMPVFSVYAQVDDKNNVLDDIVEKIRQETATTWDYEYNYYTEEYEYVEVENTSVSITSVGNNQYVFRKEAQSEWDSNLTIYFGIKNDVFYLSNVSDDIPSGSAKGMLKDIEDEITSCRAFFALDLSKVVKMIKENDERDYKKAKKYVDLSILDKLVFRTTQEGKFEAYLSVESGKKIKDLFFD